MHRNHLYCKEFIDKSKYVYNWMKKQPSVGEESITDWLLFALSESLTSLKYKTFSRHKEARETGADWEWWFVDDKKALCLRIQAKKLFASKDNYNSLAYTNKYGLQIEKLIDNAKTKNALPFYTFYYSSPCNPKVLCAGTTWNKKDCGIFISPAKQLYNDFIIHGKKKVTDSDILTLSNPLHCLVCCTNATSVDEVYRHISMSYKESITEEEGLHDSAPNYVLFLLNQKESEEIPELYEKEFEQQINDLNNLIVIDLRENYNKTLERNS